MKLTQEELDAKYPLGTGENYLDIPAWLKLTDAERKEAWERNPPKPWPKFDGKPKHQDEQTLAMLAEREAKDKAKSYERIHKLKEKKIDRTGMRWDTRRSRWVPEFGTVSAPAPASSPQPVARQKKRPNTRKPKARA